MRQAARWTKLGASVAAIGTVAGCVPFAVPPLHVDGGLGASRSQAAGQAPRAGLSNTLRAAVAPLQFGEDLAQSVDIGLGYLDEKSVTGSEKRTRGGFFELGLMRPIAAPAPNAVRAGPFVSAELLWPGQGGGPALGATLGGRVEFVSFTTQSVASNEDAEGSVFGGALGQYGLGLWGGLSARPFEDRMAWIGTLGVSLRTPGVVGVVCCMWPGSSTTTSSNANASSPSSSTTNAPPVSNKRTEPHIPAAPSVTPKPAPEPKRGGAELAAHGSEALTVEANR